MSSDIFANQPLFSEPSERTSFPAPLAVALDILVSETVSSGEASTADELAATIEVLAAWLGRLWVAEYLTAIAQHSALANPTLNRVLVERTSSKKPTLTGQWIGLARWLRGALSGHPTIVAGLSAIDFGVPGDGGAIDRLLHFRNHFSHGSFASTVREIRAHRQILHDVLARVPGLRSQPVLCRNPDTGDVQAATSLWPVVKPPSGEPLPESHPIIMGEDGSRLDLYPLLHVSHAGGGAALCSPSAAHPPSAILENPALRVWLERYERERQGHLPYTGPTETGTFASAEALRARLADPAPGLVLVEGHPDCGAANAVAALTEADLLGLGLSRFDSICRIAIREGDLSQSGRTVARSVLRAVEVALGEADGSRAGSDAELFRSDGLLDQALRDLSASGASVLLGIADLHFGVEPPRGEVHTVVSVYERLASSPVTVVATVVPGVLQRPLFDHRIVVSAATDGAGEESSMWVERLTARRVLHQRVLRALSSSAAPMHVFSLCEALELAAGDTVFEPAVERALWDLRPILTWERKMVEVEPGVSTRVRLWRPFAAGLGQMLGGGEA